MLKDIYNKVYDYLIRDTYHKIDEHQGRVVDAKKVDSEPCQLKKARSFHGLHEVTDNDVLYKLLGFDPAKTSWCAGFVNSIERLCNREGTGKLLARSFLNYGKRTDFPKAGDIVVFKRGKLSWQGHVGYYIKEDASGVLVLGGNQNNKVCYKYYPKNKVLGYRRVE